MVTVAKGAAARDAPKPGFNPANSISDISTCKIITKTNNLDIDAAVGKTKNINSQANGNGNSFGTWSHNGNI